MACSVTLDKSSLNNIPTHAMQYISLSSTILSHINRIYINFILGTTFEKRKLHLLSWDSIFQPKSEGGLKMQRAKIQNDTFNAGLSWRYYYSPVDYGLPPSDASMRDGTSP